MRTYPEWATFVGDHRYGNRLRDASVPAITAEFAHARDALAQARLRKDIPAADRETLRAQARRAIERQVLPSQARPTFRNPPVHSVVLDQGSVPQPVLERAVEAWIAGAGDVQR